jgi:hypothetical protein
MIPITHKNAHSNPSDKAEEEAANNVTTGEESGSERGGFDRVRVHHQFV